MPLAVGNIRKEKETTRLNLGFVLETLLCQRHPVRMSLHKHQPEMIEYKYMRLIAILLLSVFPVSFSSDNCTLCDSDQTYENHTYCADINDWMLNFETNSSECSSYKYYYQEECCYPINASCKLCDSDENLLENIYLWSEFQNCGSWSSIMRRSLAESDECIANKTSYQLICCQPKPQYPTQTPSSPPNYLPPSFDNQNQSTPNPFMHVIIGVIIVLILVCLTCVSMRRNETVQSQQEHPTGDQQATPSAPPEATVSTAIARQELFLERFLFQMVLSDKSNIYAASIRSLDAERANNDHTLSRKEEEEESNDVDDDPKLTPDEGKVSSWTRMLSSWRKPAKSDECCICLENYEPGQLICAAVTDKCNHAFHEDCMKNWFEDHDTCPICRTNFVES